MTGAILQAKAREMHKRLSEARGDGAVQEFTALSGWMWRFCQRHTIRQLSLQGEKLSADKPAAEQFIPEFQVFVRDGGYSLDQVFNCDETGLYCKLLPQKSLAAHFEKSADGCKTQKERITIDACSGKIKLPLLFIGKAKNPRCFKNTNHDHLPVVYTNQKNAWVDAALFTDWFHQKFVPTVQAKLRVMGLEPKAVLLLNNCSAHPDEEELISADSKVIAKFLPPNVTSLIQPMDQGVLESIKHRYWKKILEELVLRDEDGTSIIDFLKGINMLKVTKMIAASWNEIKEKTLRLSWRKILPLEDDEESQEDRQESDADPSAAEFQSYFQVLEQELDESDIGEWLQADTSDNGYAHMSEAEIISQVISPKSHDSNDETEAVAEHGDDSSASSSPLIQHGHAVKMFDSCIAWLQQQDEASAYNISMLSNLRELAAKKRLTSITQKKLTDYFSV